MRHLKCTLPNASLLINGVAFAAAAGGVVSVEPLTDEQHALFVGIQGYQVLAAETKAVVVFETKDYSDGTQASGTPPLPGQSPDQQDVAAADVGSLAAALTTALAPAADAAEPVGESTESVAATKPKAGKK